jgi:uncharacterized protein YndB with AHSA1/START domain
MNINKSAPVTASDEIFINTPIELAWNVLSDISNWPRWNAEVAYVDLAGPLHPGTEFRWKAGGTKIASRLEEVEAPHRLVWTGRTLGIKAVHAWTFEKEESGTRVRTEESFYGFLAGLFSRPLQRMLTLSLKQGLSALKTEAERQTGER